jgi:Ni/Co efflux regulator RcnB
MFKKTLIAMAVASVVAAPIASADVKISGVVELQFLMLLKNRDRTWQMNMESQLFSAIPMFQMKKVFSNQSIRRLIRSEN